jgi:hypothetical protein
MDGNSYHTNQPGQLQLHGCIPLLKSPGRNVAFIAASIDMSGKGCEITAWMSPSMDFLGGGRLEGFPASHVSMLSVPILAV